MSKDKREPEYPAELESQFIIRLPEGPARELKELLRNGGNIKNRLSMSLDSDMRKGELMFDNKMMHGKIVDLPTVVESMKTIDNKSFYKTADISQMMICKEEPDQTTDDELPSKNKKKDPYKVDKKFLYPHGLTPPTKNVRKRRFRKTLKKKCAEAPEIEKEVKRLLRADNEAESVTFEIINEEDEHLLYPKQDYTSEPSTSKGGNIQAEKKGKAGRSKRETASVTKREMASTSDQLPKNTGTSKKTTSKNAATSKNTATAKNTAKNTATKNTATKNTATKNTATSNVVDIFGGAVSDSDLEDEHNIHGYNEESQAGFAIPIPKAGTMIGLGDIPDTEPLDFDPQMFELSRELQNKAFATNKNYDIPSTSHDNAYSLSYFDDEGDQSRDSKDSMTLRIEQVKAELDELKERKNRTQQEIFQMENMTLRKRFQETLHTINQEVMYKDMEYQGLLTLQNSEDI